MALTKRQKEIYSFILEYRSEHRCSPTIPEIQQAFRIASPNGVAGHLKALEAKGYISRADRGSRAIEPLDAARRERSALADLPVFGNIPAGPPTSYEDAVGESYVSIDTASLGFRPQAGCYVLRVQGTSMEGAGIFHNDSVVIDPNQPPQSGDIVAALLITESTLKRFRSADGDTWLEAEFADRTETIRDSFSVQGVVRTLIRRF